MTKDSRPSNKQNSSDHLQGGESSVPPFAEIAEGSDEYWLAAIIKLAADAVDEDNAGRMIPLAGLTDEQIYGLM